jgi:predicted PurR-regulated permease PerM
MPQAISDKPLQPAWRTSLIWLGLAAIGWLILKMLAPVLTPFVVALVLAYSLLPAVERLYGLTKRRLPRIVCVLLVELGFLLITTAVVLLIVPIVGKELPLLKTQLPSIADRVNSTLQPLLASLGIDFSLDPATVKSFALEYLEANSGEVWAHVLPSLKMGGGLLLSIVGYVVLVPVVLFYFLADWTRVVTKAQLWIPPAKLPAVQSFLSEADSVLGQYMRGQLLVMLVLAVYYCITLSLWGLDLALPIGVFTGLAICIPYIGFGIGLIMAMLAAVLQFGIPNAALMLVVIYGIGQVIEGFVLTPRLVGERIGLHPLAVIFALLAFGEIFGFIGVLVALPVSAVLLVAMRRVKAKYLASDLYSQ